MANTIITPNMGLPLPVPGVDPGPDYANQQTAAGQIIDAHNHTPGNGVLIPPDGININAALTFQNNPATDLQASVYIPQPSFLTLYSVYFSGVDLYANDGSGNVIQITSAGTVNATSSGISSGTASASFSSGVLIVNAAANTPANIQVGSVLLGNNVANSKFLTLSPPAAMPANYTLVLPHIPVVKSIMTLDTSGNMNADYTLDGSTIAVSGGVIGIPNGAITTVQISPTAAILGSQLSASANILGSQLDPAAGILGTQIANQTIAQGNLKLKTTQNGAPVGGFAVSVTSGNWIQNVGADRSLTGAHTVTISIASPAVVTINTTTGLYVGQPVVFTTTGTLPTGIVSGTTYYISNIPGGTTFRISATVYGTDINTSGSQSGVHTATWDILSVSLTTTGRPVFIGLIPDGTTTGSYIGGQQGAAVGQTGIGAIFTLTNDGSTISTHKVENAFNTSSAIQLYVPPGSFYFYDTPAAGSYSYAIKSRPIDGATNAQVFNCKLIAYEI